MSEQWTMILYPHQVTHAMGDINGLVHFRLIDRPGCLFFMGESFVMARCDGGDPGDEQS